MEMSSKINRKLHAICSKLGKSHADLKREAYFRFKKDYSSLDNIEAEILYRKLANLEYIQRNGNFYAKKTQFPAKVEKKLKMKQKTNVALHRVAESLGADHKKLMQMAKELIGKLYCELSDIEGWKLYYILTQNARKLEEINKQLEQ